MVTTYTASLASNLTKAGSRYIISGINDIKKGKLPSNRIGVIENTAMEQYYLREISQGNRNFYKATSRQQILDSLFGGTIDATFLDSGVAEYITNNIHCNLTVVGGTFNDGVFGIVMPKNWLYEQDLNMNILSLRESGQLDNLRKKWFQTGKCDHSDETLHAIRIESMAGLFLIFGIITVLSLLPFV
jgi:ABC-type amino acid transport substrate-binding protein